MSTLNLDDLNNNDLNKRLLTQINIDDWPGKCGKCGQPKLLHRELHRVSYCNNLENLLMYSAGFGQNIR